MSKRNPFEAPHVESRRGGPQKEPLSRDAIVAEALKQLTASGPGGMSLRKVAAALRTGPASLYAYVDDLEELHSLVLDRALAKVDTRGAKGRTWRERIHHVLTSYARVLSASPGLAQLALGTVAVGPHALRVLETLLALLEEGGVAPATAAWAIDLMILYVTAIVAEHAHGLDPAHPEGSVARAIDAASAEQYPHISAARAQLLSGTGEERFAWAIEVFLRGILAAPRPTSSGRSPAKTQRKPRRA